MAKYKKLKSFYKEMFKFVDATEEQLDFLLEQYLDEDSIIGIHNTFLTHEPFFEIGLYNQTYMGKDTTDLSNTVMYNDVFAALMMYPNGDGKIRDGSAIILKIPKKVFTKEQGIFETLQDGRFGIPPQFIVAAFRDGKVIENQGYDKQYKSDEAIKCEDTLSMTNKQEHGKAFKKVCNSKKSLKDIFINFMKKIRGERHKQLLLTDREGYSNNRRNSLVAELVDDAPSLAEQKEFIDTRNSISLHSNDFGENGIEEKQ